MNDDISGSASRNDLPEDCKPGADAAAMSSVAADPEVMATDAAFWQGARVVMPRPKEIVTVRLDADLLAWLRQERGYQTRINAVLRAYMEAGVRDR